MAKNKQTKPDPLTDEIIEYDRTHCPVRTQRMKCTKIFGNILGVCLVCLFIFLIFYFVSDGSDNDLFLALTIIFTIFTVADLIWYPFYMFGTIKALKRENKAIEEWTRNRLKQAAIEKRRQEQAKANSSITKAKQ